MSKWILRYSFVCNCSRTEIAPKSKEDQRSQPIQISVQFIVNIHWYCASLKVFTNSFEQYTRTPEMNTLAAMDAELSNDSQDEWEVIEESEVGVFIVSCGCFRFSATSN